MDKREVIEFFNRCSSTWDAEMVLHEELIAAILQNAGIRPGMDVLDVACGTGVLFPFYLEHGVNAVTGIDISPEMIRLAGEKFRGEERVHLICGDAEEYSGSAEYDMVMVYNAFPHFSDAEKLIAALASHLKQGGRLSIAHGMSRERVIAHHEGSARHVSQILPPAEELAELLRAQFDVDVVLSTASMYQVCGTKR